MKKALFLLLVNLLCLQSWSINTINSDEQCSSLYKNACLLENQGKFGEALNVFTQINEYYKNNNRELNALNANSLHHIGRCCLSLDKKDGIIYAQQAADIRKKLFGERNEDYINSLNNVGLFYFESKNYNKSLEIHKSVVNLCSKLKKPHPNNTMFNLNLSRDYIALNENSKAETIFSSELANIKKQYGDKSGEYADLLLTIGRVYYDLGDKKTSVRYFEKALYLYPVDSEKYEKLLDNVCSIYVELNDNNNIVKYMALVNEHSQLELKKECHEPKCMIERAEYYAIKGDIANAKDCYIKAIAMCDSTNVTEIERYNVKCSYAKFLCENHDYINSAENYVLASEIVKNDSSYFQDYASAIYNAGLSFYFAKEYEKSIDYLKQSSDCFSRLGTPSLKNYLMSLSLIGNNFCALNDYDSAMIYYKKALDVCKSNGIQDANLAEVYSKTGNVLYHKNDYSQALVMYEASAEIYKKENNDFNYKSTLMDIQRCYTMMGNKEGQIENNDSITSSTDPLDRILKEEMANLDSYKILFGEDGLQYANSLGIISDILYYKGRYAESVDYYTKYLNSERAGIRNNFRLLGEADRNRIWNEQINDMDTLMLHSYYSSFSNDKYVSSEFAKMAYDVQLISKGIMLNSYIEFENILKHSQDKTLLQNYTLIKQNAEKIKELQNSLSNGNNVSSLEDANRLKLENEKLQVDLMKKSTDYGDYTKYLSLNWQDVQSSLDDDAVAIEFARLKTGLFDNENTYIAIIIRKGWNAPKIIKLLTQRKMQNCENDSDMYNKSALGELIWKPVSQYLDGVKTVYFSPDADLYQIGIEYLLYNGVPFNQGYNVYRLSSTKELAMKRNTIDDKKAALFGGLTYTMSSTAIPKVKKSLGKVRGKNRSGVFSFDELPSTKLEVNEIAQSLRKKNVSTEIYSGKNGTEKAFMNLSGTDVNILHIATHGDYCGDNTTKGDSAMNYSILALSGANEIMGVEDNDGIINATEIAGMDLRKCDLAVLSACRTGNGSVHDDGVFGLQRGFKNAGVRTMIMSLWKVDDKATYLMMSQFYKNLSLGYSKYDSFIKSQKYLCDNGFNDSKYWAAFIMLDGLK